MISVASTDKEYESKRKTFQEIGGYSCAGNITIMIDLRLVSVLNLPDIPFMTVLFQSLKITSCLGS